MKSMSSAVLLISIFAFSFDLCGADTGGSTITFNPSSGSVEIMNSGNESYNGIYSVVLPPTVRKNTVELQPKFINGKEYGSVKMRSRNAYDLTIRELPPDGKIVIEFPDKVLGIIYIKK